MHRWSAHVGERRSRVMRVLHTIQWPKEAVISGFLSEEGLLLVLEAQAAFLADAPKVKAPLVASIADLNEKVLRGLLMSSIASK